MTNVIAVHAVRTLEPCDTVLSVAVPATLKTALRQAAEDRGVTVSASARELLERGLADRDKAE